MNKQEYTVRNAKPEEFGEIGREQNAAGFRLLFVDPLARGQGIGKLLTNECIRKAKDKKTQSGDYSYHHGNANSMENV
jgi:GNAT superfamily N-acetyltransferase